MDRELDGYVIDMCNSIVYDLFPLRKKNKNQAPSLWEAYIGRKGQTGITAKQCFKVQGKIRLG